MVPYEETGRECRTDDPVAPAYQAGLRTGDVLVAFNGTRASDWAVFSEMVRANGDKTAEITYLRDGVEQTTETTTMVTARPRSAEDLSLVKVGFLGIQPVTELGTGGPIYTAVEMGDMTVRTLQAMVSLPVKVWGVAKAIVGIEERDPEGPMSIVGGGRAAGELVAEERLTVTDKAVSLMLLIAGFNFFIGMFNFVPLLPLDGGHIAGAVVEGARKGIARVRGKPDPGFIDVAKLMPLAYVGAAALLVMSVVLIVADLVVPLSVT